MQPFYDDHNVDHFLPEGRVVEWRASVYGVLQADGKLLMIKDGRSTHGWAFPGGGPNMGESFADALKREVFEETGYRVRLMSERPLWIDTSFFYDRPIDKYYRSVLMFYSVELEHDVQDTSLVNTIEPDEISAIEWVPFKDLSLDDCHRMIHGCIDVLKSHIVDQNIK